MVCTTAEPGRTGFNRAQAKRMIPNRKHKSTIRVQRTIKLVLLAAAAGLYGSAQQISNRGNSFRVEPHTNTTIRLDANLVLVPVTVTDSRGRVVANLPQADFTLLEEKRPQNILSFSRETAPVSLGIVVDLSGSMANKIRATHTAVNEFLKNLEPEDEEFLVTFADRPELRLPLTSEPSGIYDALSYPPAHWDVATGRRGSRGSAAIAASCIR